LTSPIFAQTDDCQCDPDTGIWQSYYYPICEADRIIGIDQNGSPIYERFMCIYVQVTYQVLQCGGSVAIKIQDFKIVDAREPNDIVIQPCNFLTSGPDLFKYAADAAKRLAEQYGSILTIRFPQGCASFAEVQWPDGTTIIEPPGEGGGSVRKYQVQRSFHRLDCNVSECCTATFRFDDATRRYIPVSTTGPVWCGDGVYPPAGVITWETQDEQGNPVTHTGTIVNMTACEMICGYYPPGGGAVSFTSTITSDRETKPVSDLASTFIYPKPANDVIYIQSKATVVKAEIYDMKGKLVLTQIDKSVQSLNISPLKQGAYFVRLYDANFHTEVFKILK
jgi:hypothetical protein